MWPAAYTTTTYAYSGQIYLDGSTYSFAENIDDNVYLNIGGTTVLSNTSYTAISSGAIQLAAGWYPVAAPACLGLMRYHAAVHRRRAASRRMPRDASSAAAR